MDKILISLAIAAVFMSSMSLSSFLIKVCLAGIIIMIGVPISINYVTNKIKEGGKKNKVDYAFSKNYRQSVKLIKPEDKSKGKYFDGKYITRYNCNKEVKDENYVALRKKIIVCSKNRVFERIDIINLKEEIDRQLDSHVKVYQGFEFQNDLHEIYIKLKSSKLDEQSYTFLNDYVDKIIQSKVTEVKE